MDLHVHGFGIVSLFTAGIGCSTALVLAVVALVRLRHVDRLAMAMVIAGALAEFTAMGGELFRMALGSALWSAAGDHYLALTRLQDAWFVGRPLIHTLALAAIAIAVVRLSAVPRRAY